MMAKFDRKREWEATAGNKVSRKPSYTILNENFGTDLIKRI